MAIDDFWRAGKVRGFGGPWQETEVKAGIPSDAFLMNGFDKKTLTLIASADTNIKMEVDVTGWGVWVTAGEYTLTSNMALVTELPRAFGGYWVRFLSVRDGKLTAQFAYE